MTHRPAPRIILGGLLLAALAAPAQAQAPRGAATMFALPSDIIARELAFARAVRDKGQWQAFRSFATDDAQMFAGDTPVRVQEWARKQREPASVLQWETQAVWMSCDGATAATYGAWQAGEAHGWFSTLWQRQKKGAYRFILDTGDTTAQPLPTPEFAEARVADCPVRHRADKPAPDPAPQAPADHLSGEAPDHTLSWATTMRADGGRDYVLRVKLDGQMQDVLHKVIAAQKQGPAAGPQGVPPPAHTG